MSHVVRLELRNWGPYRGDHALDLGPEVYAVVARYDSNAELSNAAGKSSLLGAIRFALFGERPEEHALEDDWVTRGEKDGSVRIAMSDGVAVQRNRTIGSSTKLEVLVPGQAPATGKHGAEVLAKYLLLTREDFAASLWVGQKDVARLVLAQPAERAELVEGWLGLGPLRAAEKAANACAEREGNGAALLRRVAAELNEQLAQLALLSIDKVAALSAEVAHAKDAAAALEARVERAARAEGRAQHRAQAEARANRLCSIVEEARRLTEQVDRSEEDTSELEQTEAYLATKVATARVEHDRLDALVLGEGFDGKCPVTCGDCPVAADVREQARELGSQFATATKVRDDAVVSLRMVRERLSEVRDRQRLAERADERLRLAEEALEQEPELPPPAEVSADLAELRDRRVAWLEAAREAQDELAAHARDSARASALGARLAEAERDATESEASAKTYAEAAQVLRGARREVAELAVADVEGSACAMLAEAGIDLTVEFRWEREGQKLATACHNCGAAYPGKQSVKKCERCGADRKQQVREQLELLPSRRSGGADDLAGLGVQLSAAAWLRERRGSPLGLVVVDEPFAALDVANSRALGAHLHRALSGGLRFEQAFIIAHDQSVTEAMPRRIVVRSDGTHARLEVE